MITYNAPSFKFVKKSKSGKTGTMSKKKNNGSAMIEGMDPVKYASLKTYYSKIRKGARPEQTRKDCDLSLEDIEQFDFSVF